MIRDVQASHTLCTAPYVRLSFIYSDTKNTHEAIRTVCLVFNNKKNRQWRRQQTCSSSLIVSTHLRKRAFKPNPACDHEFNISLLLSAHDFQMSWGCDESRASPCVHTGSHLLPHSHSIHSAPVTLLAVAMAIHFSPLASVIWSHKRHT